jgi:hypothetical protein
MATSDTISTTLFQTQKVIDNAARMCRLTPQQLSSEHLDTANDLLYLILSSLNEKGVALWAIHKEILPMYYGTQTVPLPVGTLNVMNCNLRNYQRITGVASSSEGDAENAFDSDVDTACTQVTPAGYIQAQLSSETRMEGLGILPNDSGTWDVTLSGSNDGVSFTTLYQNTEFEAAEQEWFWVDIQGIAPWTYLRLTGGATTVLDVAELFFGNMPNEIPLAKVNRDDYSDLPNKTFLSRPTEFWYDRRRYQPVVNLWPVPNDEFTFYQLVAFLQKHLQDVGSMTQEIDVPQRWLLPITTMLAERMARSFKEVDVELIPMIADDAANLVRAVWDGETDDSPVMLMPNIRVYTRG